MTADPTTRPDAVAPRPTAGYGVAVDLAAGQIDLFVALVELLLTVSTLSGDEMALVREDVQTLRR